MHLHDANVDIHYDRTMRTRAHLRRVRSNRDELWGYLQWWPRTLKLHGKKTWVIVWFFGAFLLYGVTYGLVCAEWLSRKVRKRLPAK
jgi:hypothetical protein